MKAIIITGTSGGLGKAMFDYLKKIDALLISISRRLLPDQKESAAKNKKIILIKHDLKNTKQLIAKCNFSKRLSAMKIDEIVFINNAGTVEPIGLVGSLKQESIHQAAAVNMISPMLIANDLLSIAKQKKAAVRIINISTGAAKRPIAGWAAYCSTKSGIKMFFEVVQEQEKHGRVIVKHIDPGVMNTEMQKRIRGKDGSSFPLQKYFIELKKKNKLQSPRTVAERILAKENLI